MTNQDFTQWPHADGAAETGPDYVALVIEWDDVADDAVTQVREASPHMELVAPSLLKKIALGAGALGALVVARWGIHRLRHA